MNIMLREYVLKKNDDNGLYIRRLYESTERAKEAARVTGEELIEGDLSSSKAIQICERHNKLILDKLRIVK